MKKNLIAVCVVAGLFSMGLQAAPVVTVNGQAIDKSVVDEQVKSLVARSGGQVQDTPALREEIKNQLIDQTLVMQEAKKRGLDRSKEYQAALSNFQTQLLGELYIQEVVKKASVSDSEAKQIYDQQAAALKGTQEVKLRQIVTDNQEDAQKALAELNSKKSFASVAQKYSKDGLKDKGGLIDSWENLKNFQNNAPAIYDAIASLAKGQHVKQVVNINGSYALFQVEDKRNAQIPPFNDVKDQIKNALAQQKLTQSVQELRQKATIK